MIGFCVFPWLSIGTQGHQKKTAATTTTFWSTMIFGEVLLMEEILRQLIGSLSQYLAGGIDFRWLAGFQST